MIIRPDTRRGTDTMGDYDAGLEHNHDWARERAGVRHHAPIVADAPAARTPSSVLHDDAIYSAV